MLVEGQVATCLDGTPFPVEWEEPEDAGRHWRWNGGHFPLPLKPLTVALVTAPGARAAARRPFEEFNLPLPSGMAYQRYLHGFQYLCTDLIGPAYGRANAGVIQAVVSAHTSPFSVWQTHCEPRIKALLADVRAGAGAKPLAALAEEAVEAMFLTQVAAAVTGPVTAPLIQVCTEAFGSEGEALAWELTHGGENLTRDADQALWDLAQIADRYPATRALVLSEDAGSLDALRDRPDAAAFVTAFEAYLERYGERVESWGYDTPTLREQPERLIDLVRRTIAEQRPSPAALVRQAAERRAALAAELRARLADRPEMLARFDAALAEVTPYVTIREDRAYWQLLASGVMRTAIIGRGRRLAEMGALADAEDIYFLLPDEVGTVESTGVMSDDLAAAIDTRRREWEYWAAVTPPETLGPEGDAVVEATPRDEPMQGSGLKLRGIAASRGVAAGRACVATSLEEAERLEPGQVLVCVMTAPPWTPLFGIAAAIVTDTGLTISHAAIAAREYGIPCVVGARTATRDIPDGALVTVDGTSGVVRVELDSGNTAIAQEQESPRWEDGRTIPPGFWTRNEHFALPLPPLEADVRSFGRAFEVAGDEFALLVPGPQSVVIDGWVYGGMPSPASPPSPERVAAFEEKVRSRHELTVLRRWREEHRPAARAELDRLGAIDRSELSDADLLTHIRTLVDLAGRLFEVHATDGTAAMLVFGRLGLFCRERLGLSDAEIIGLLAGNSTASSEPTVALEALAAELVADPALSAALQTADPWDDPRVRAVLQPYLDTYGHRLVDFYYESPTLAEQPRRAVRLMQEAISRVMSDKASARTAASNVLATESVLRERLPDDADRMEFDRLLREARAAYGVRDDDVSFVTWARGLTRYAIMEAGRRLTERGFLAAPDHVWYLRQSELESCLTGAMDRDLRELVTARQAEHQRRKAAVLPPQTLGTPFPPAPLPPLSDEAQAAVRARAWARSLTSAPEWDSVSPAPSELRGVAGSAGVYTGRARVLLSESGFDRIEPGDVLVCSYSSPSWTIIFGSLGAVVADAGGLLSHAAITAREYGIPAVVGVKTATNLIPDGAIVTVDGTNGVVRIADASGAMAEEAP